MKTKLPFLFIILFSLNNSIAQNQTINNVAIGTDPQAYGTTIKANFPSVDGGWARGYRISNETGNQPFIMFGCLGNSTNGVASVFNSFIGTDYTNQYMTFLPSGNIGIGTTTPTEQLEIGGLSKFNIKIGRWATIGTTGGGLATIIGNNVKASQTTDNKMEFITSTSDGAKAIKLQYDEGITFHTVLGSVNANDSFSNHERMRIDNNGNVGIGTINPSHKFEVVVYNLPAASLNRNGSFGEILKMRRVGTGVDVGLGVPESGELGIYSNAIEKIRMNSIGNLGIGTTNPDEKLTVKGKIHAEEIKVDLLVPADYVFEKYYTGKSELKSDYSLPTLAEIESFTKENHHLPNVPSAKEIQQNGLSLGEMSNILLQKVEELTLYIIKQEKKIKEQDERIMSLEKKK